MKNKDQKKFLTVVALGAFIVLLWGCASKQTEEVKKDQDAPKAVSTDRMEGTPDSTRQPSSPPAPAATGYYIHTVKWAGESVSIIAGWYLGDIHKWEVIRDCNPDMDPNVVVIGQKIRIPESLMTTRTPMTKAHVDKFYPKADRPKRAPPAHKGDTPALYGPK
jgi:hypothetical protein